jgi:hypothetical protein
MFFLFLFLLFFFPTPSSVSRTHARTHERTRMSFEDFFKKEFSFRATVTTIDRKKVEKLAIVRCSQKYGYKPNEEV